MVAEHSTDLAAFVPADVIELQTHRITLPAVHARMSGEERQEAKLMVLKNLFVPLQRFLDVRESVPMILGPHLCPSAVPASDLANAPPLAFPVEFTDRFATATARTVLVVHGPRLPMRCDSQACDRRLSG